MTLRGLGGKSAHEGSQCIVPFACHRRRHRERHRHLVPGEAHRVQFALREPQRLGEPLNDRRWVNPPADEIPCIGQHLSTQQHGARRAVRHAPADGPGGFHQPQRRGVLDSSFIEHGHAVIRHGRVPLLIDEELVQTERSEGATYSTSDSHRREDVPPECVTARCTVRVLKDGSFHHVRTPGRGGYFPCPVHRSEGFKYPAPDD